MGGLDLEFGVLRPAKTDTAPTVNSCRRDAPTTAVPHDDEEELALPVVEVLHEPAPALIASPRADRDLPAFETEAGGGLHLDPLEPVAEVRDEVVLRAVTERDADHRSL